MQAIALDLENKISHREKEIDSITEKSKGEKLQAKRELYLHTLEVMAVKDKGFSSLLMKIKNGMSSVMRDESNAQTPITHKTPI
jgi:hypothetical protein